MFKFNIYQLFFYSLLISITAATLVLLTVVEPEAVVNAETFRLCDLKHIHDSNWLCRIWK